MIKKYKIIILLYCALAVVLPSIALAANQALDRLNNAAVVAGPYAQANENSGFVLIQVLINIFLSVIGVLLLIYIVYAGYNWMTAHGEEAKVEKAKDTIKRAIIGVIIIIGAYAISVFVMSRIEAGTLKSGGGGVGGYLSPQP